MYSEYDITITDTAKLRYNIPPAGMLYLTKYCLLISFSTFLAA